MSEAAAAEGNISLDLRRVLRGTMDEMNGPEEFGRELGKILKDPEVTVAARVTLAGTIARLLGQYGEGSEDDSLLTEEQLKARARQLDEEMKDAD